MKYRCLWIFCLFVLMQSAGNAHVGEQAHSFFMPRPISMHTLLTSGSMFTAPAPKKDESSLSFEHTVFYHDSTNASDNVPYFFGKEKTSLRVDETELGDLNSEWFSISSADGSAYRSHLYVAPSRSLWGVSLRMQQALGSVYDGLWMAVNVPFVEATHNLGLREMVDATTAVADDSLFTSFKEVLDWDNWRAGRWASTSQTISGVDDVCMQVGINLNGMMESTQRVYLELSVPVGGYPTGQYLFEPLIGSAGSFGLGGGTASVIPLFESKHGLHIMLINQVHYRYHFSTRQWRTPDLKGQPFSRYLVLMDTALATNVTNVAMKAANGVNFLTRDAVVVPGATGQSVNGIEARFKGHSFTTGYSYWWRAAEQVWFEKAAVRTFAVPSPKGLVGGEQVWLPSPRIQDQFSINDPTATTNAAVMYDVEFDMDSAAASHTGSHTFFTRYVGRFDTSFCQVQVSAGGAYEFADNSAALSTWQVWGGIGVTV